MKARLIQLFIFLILAGLIALLSWNTIRLYRFERTNIQARVASSIQNAADSILNYNGSILGTYASSLTDSDYDSKIAFAAGFTHNMGKISIILSDHSLPEPSKATKPKDTSKPLVFNKSFYIEHHVRYDPSSLKNLHDFDSVFKQQLAKNNAFVQYSFLKTQMTDTPGKGAVVSEPFILEFSHPIMYSVHYTIPVSLIWRHMLPYSLSTLFICLMLFAGMVFFYKSYETQNQMSQFRESLLSNITHELKTPLSSLQLIIDSAVKESKSKPDALIPSKHIAFAETELNRMKLLVERILSFSKMNREQLLLDEQHVNLVDIIYDAVEMMDMKIQQADAEVNFEQASNVNILGDPLLLTNALAALIDNAIKYNTNKPKIKIEIAVSEKEVMITIADNGTGIKKQYRRKIFEPFFRIPAGNIHDTPGHGLGLSFVKQVAELHGGSINFSSDETGTTFYLKLPVS